MLLSSLLLAADAPAWLLTYQTREMALGRGLAVLGAWALLNLLGSGYRLPRSDRREWAHHFHLMNAGWGFVNAVLAAVGILRTHPGAPAAGLNLAGALGEQLLLENVFLLNAGLDVAYVTAGFWLVARAALPAERRPERLLGYGRSLWLQGGFLVAFDAAMWTVTHQLGAGLWQNV